MLLVAKTSLSSPPWPEVKLPDPVEEAKYHAEVVRRVNGLIAAGHYGRLFAVVHFASKQWKVTSEDLIMMDNVLEAECGDRIRMEKVLLVGADDFTLIGRPLLGKELVRVEATVIEKTESWPKINVRFRKKRNYQRTQTLTVRFITRRFIGDYDPTLDPSPTLTRVLCTSLPCASPWPEAFSEVVMSPWKEEDSLQIEEKIKWGDGFAVVYSVTDRCSFDEVMRLCFLINHIHSSPRRSSASEQPPIVIVANKKDLQFDRMVSTQDGENLSKALKLPFYEISTRDSYEEPVAVFNALYQELMRQGHFSPGSFKRRTVSKLMEKIPKMQASSSSHSAGRSLSFNSFRDYIPE
ncbi:ras-related and estrogen-regulated growth inhibitor-like protein [Amazona aestiva]|uniref:Large ribosomal subunit protein bL21m n=1 Tax=Amazona aestiva TaxID=12930 RepID=A0A0Q3LUS8_AMAAE|nr:ras-related and estrogen-regulated growth inhibitor-like protein [Amazona aestiva]